MSKIIASAAIRGRRRFSTRRRTNYKEALEKYGPDQEVGFPNTAYYLPIIYAMTGMPVAKLGDWSKVFEPVPEADPSAGQGEDATCPTWPRRWTRAWRPSSPKRSSRPSATSKTRTATSTGEDPTDGNIWLGAADDLIFRKRGVEFVDGTAPGFAAIVGAAPDAQTAAKIALELQEKNLYVFMCGENDGKTVLRAARGGRRPDRLAHAARPLRPGHPPGGLRHRLCLPRGHGLRRHQAGRLQKDPHLQQGPDLRLRHGPGRRHRRVVRQRRRRHQLGLPGHRRHAHPRGAAHGHLHLRARGLEHPARPHRRRRRSRSGA